MNRTCLNCFSFKLDDVDVGICRKIKGKGAPRPIMKTDDTCDDWQDAGPQYHIRVGWIKNKKKS